MGKVEFSLRQKLNSRFLPQVLILENESHMHANKGVHAVPETHFRAVIVSEEFVGLSRIARQRLVLGAIDAELKNEGVHAFTLRCLTNEEWQEGGADGFASPKCSGKLK